MKKKTLKDKKSIGKSLRQTYSHLWHDYINQESLYNQILGKPAKKLTKKQKEEKRRAKPMKITVGEYEDAIEDAKDYYRLEVQKKAEQARNRLAKEDY